jgi:3-methylcrotonyl-CoA carboxylase alpha subunit
MEMNTRLQVEHPVTEMITGLDLVEWQLRVAAGEPLPLTQDRLRLRGHAIEARIYAEDPGKNFLPATGRLAYLSVPEASPHVRVDTGVEQGDEITPYYDPMIAKLIVWDQDRPQARARLLQALAQYRIVGVANNVEFLARVVESASFANADLDTGLIERERESLFARHDVVPEVYWVAALAMLLGEAQRAHSEAHASADPSSPWQLRDGWRLNASGARRLVFRHGDDAQTIVVGYDDDGQYQLGLCGVVTRARGELGVDGELSADLGGRRFTAAVVVLEDKYHVFVHGRRYALTYVDPLSFRADSVAPETGLRAPMPGRVVALLVEPPARVEKGTPLLVLEAMKMEHTIVAPSVGVVRSFRFAVGAQVQAGAELLEFDAATAANVSEAQ